MGSDNAPLDNVELVIFYKNILTGIQKIVEEYNIKEVSYDSSLDRQRSDMNGLDLHLIPENETYPYDDLSTDEIAKLMNLPKQSLEGHYGRHDDVDIVYISLSRDDDPLQESAKSIDISLVNHNPEYLERLRSALQHNLQEWHGFGIELETRSAVMVRTDGSQTSEQS